jgi:hypothetical protein
MLKGREIVVGFALASVFWVFVMVLSSDPSATYQICEPSQYHDKDHCAPHHLLYVIFWYGGYIFNAGVITAVATGFIARFTWTLRQSTDKIVGSNERNLEATERAYIFHGYSPLEFKDGQARFTLNMLNAGRMPGGVSEVAWKFLARADLPQSREGIDWKWETIEYDFILRPAIRWDIARFLSFSGDNIFVTCIKYKDLFTKRDHVTYMAMHIYPDRPERERVIRAGGDTWNYWD